MIVCLVCLVLADLVGFTIKPRKGHGRRQFPLQGGGIVEGGLCKGSNCEEIKREGSVKGTSHGLSL